MFFDNLWKWFLDLNDFMKIGFAGLVGVPIFVWLVFVAVEAVLHFVFWPLTVSMLGSAMFILIGFYRDVQKSI